MRAKPCLGNTAVFVPETYCLRMFSQYISLHFPQCIALFCIFYIQATWGCDNNDRMPDIANNGIKLRMVQYKNYVHIFKRGVI